MTAARWLLVGAHHDDVELGVGGYLSRALREGDTTPEQVAIAVASCGESVMRTGEVVTGKTRHAEQLEAMKIAGIESSVLYTGPFEENKVDLAPQAELMDWLSDVIEEHKPEEIYMPLPGFNQDHRAVHEAMIATLRPTKRMLPTRVWAYEYPGDSWGGLTVSALPSWGWCYVTLTGADLAKKLVMCGAHKSQFGNRPGNHVSEEGVAKLAALRGSECGHDYAERLLLMREVYR